jgi:hypothetical protein
VLVSLGGLLEGFRNNVEVITCGLGLLDRFLGGLGSIGSSGISTGSTPSTLTGSKDSVNHVDPVEEGVDNEHERVKHNLVTAELGTKVQHEQPVESKRDGDETDGEVADFLGGGDQGDDQDEEEKSGGTDSVLHESNDEEDGVALPEADICQHANFVGDKTQEPSATLLEERSVVLDGFGLAESSGVHLDLVAFLCANHEQVSEPTILAQMALAVIEEIVALLGLVSEVLLGHLAECGKSKHSKGTGQTGDGTAAGFDGTFEELTVNVFHVLKQSDERVLLRGRRNDTGLRQHVLLAARLEFHLVHKVLDACLVEDTVGVDEQDEQVVVALDVLAVDLVDELEGPLLAMTLTAVGETGDGDTAATVDDIDGLGVRIKGERHAELLNGVEVQLVFLVSVEGEEDVEARRRVFAVDKRVACSEQDIGDLLVAGHDNDDLGGGSLVKNRFDAPGATNGVGDELIDTEQPRDGQETGERPESEPLQEVNHLLGEVLDDLRW